MRGQGVDCAAGERDRSGPAVFGAPERDRRTLQVDVLPLELFGFAPAATGIQQEHQQIGRGGLAHGAEELAETGHLLIGEHPVLGVAAGELAGQRRDGIEPAMQHGVGHHRADGAHLLVDGVGTVALGHQLLAPLLHQRRRDGAELGVGPEMVDGLLAVDGGGALVGQPLPADAQGQGPGFLHGDPVAWAHGAR